MPEQKDMIEGLSDFACRLYGRFDRDRNLFFSPHSISSAFSLVYHGARGNTADQMAKALSYPPSDSGTVAGMLAGLAKSNDEGVRISVANSAWIQKEYAVLDEYVQKLDAAIRRMDFAGPGAAEEINAWVSEHTNGLIRDLIPPGVLDCLTRLVLVNAIYFKGLWTSPFDEKRTHDADFHNLDGSISGIRMMFRKGDYRYTHNSEYDAAFLPYGNRNAGSRARMLVIVPNDFVEFSQTLDSCKLAKICGQCHSHEINLFLPRFKTEHTAEISKKMMELGMTDAFSSDPAVVDFSGISGERDLYISAVLHKALVDVTEEGTEAAAATAIVMRKCACIMSTPELRADRPFIYVIFSGSGAPLFMGHTVSL